MKRLFRKRETSSSSSSSSSGSFTREPSSTECVVAVKQVKSLKEENLQLLDQVKQLKAKNLELETKNSENDKLINKLLNQNQVLQRPLDTTTKEEPKAMSELIIDPSDFDEVEKIGAGRFGKVYLVRSSIGKLFAKKIFDEKMNEQQAQKFLKECEIGSQVVHPCVIRLLGFSMQTEENCASIFFEYANRGTLQDLLDHKPREWTETRKSICILEIAFGMKYLHENKIIHRDLKPSNVLCIGNFHFKISDFSESTFGDSESTMTNLVGTTCYMSPEILGDEGYNETTDVFSFGVILFYISTGFLPKVPLRAFLSGKRADIPSSVNQFMRDLITRCWQESKDSRPSFSEIIASLESHSFQTSEGVDEFIVRDRYDELSSI